MTLQQISLDQSIYNKRKPRQQGSPISQALRPREGAGMTMGGMSQGSGASQGMGFMERTQKQQALEGERKYQEKMMKLQHEQEMEKLKFAAAMKEDTEKRIRGQELSDRRRITSGWAKPTATGQEPTAPALTKENMPEAAMEIWKFISTLEPESQKHFIQQLKEKEQPTGGFMESGGKRIEMPGSLGMYGHLVNQGLLDPKTDTVIKGRGIAAGKWKYDEKDNLMYNEETGETVKMSIGIKDIDSELISDAYNYGSTYMGRLTNPTLLEKINPENMTLYMENAKKESQLATMNYLLGQGVGKKEAKDIAYSIPFEERGTTKTPTTTSKEADEETADIIYSNVKDKESITKEEEDYYRATYGDATWELVKKKMEEKPVKKFVPPPATEPTSPYSTLKKKEEPIKDYFKKYKSL